MEVLVTSVVVLCENQVDLLWYEIKESSYQSSMLSFLILTDLSLTDGLLDADSWTLLKRSRLSQRHLVTLAFLTLSLGDRLNHFLVVRKVQRRKIRLK